MKNNNHAVFFDLDGTLLDTAPDLYAAMLDTLKQMGHDTVSFEHFRPHVHTGTASMIKGSLGIDETNPEFSKIRQIFLDYYKNQIHKETDYFPGMSTVLEHLDQQKIPWGIVTNKPAFLTDPLIESFDLLKRSQCVISGDTLPRRKPYPDPLLHACKLVNIIPQHSVYIGDTENDIIAATAAGMQSVAVLYGYHDPNSPPNTWGADHLVEKPLQLVDVLNLAV